MTVSKILSTLVFYISVTSSRPWTVVYCILVDDNKMYIIIYQTEASNTSCTFYFVNKLAINTRDTFYTIYQGSMRDDTPCILYIILLTSWQSVCNWQLSHVYFYTTCSQLQTPCTCILADSKCQMDPRRQCTPSIHNVQYSVHELTMNMIYIF